MGYYGEYFSTLFKGTGAMAFKEGWNVRKIVKNLKRADKTLYTDLPELIEKKHEVSEAMRKERAALRQLKQASESAYKLLLEAEMQESSMLKELENVATALGDVKGGGARAQGIEANIIAHVLSSLEKGEQGDRQEYKDVMAIMEQAGKGKETLRNTIRLRFQKMDSQTFLARLAARSEIKTVGKSVHKLSGAAKRIRGLKGKNRDEVESVLPSILKDVEQAAKEGIAESILIKRRAIIWIMKILYDLDNAYDQGVKYANVHFLPSQFSAEIKQHTQDTSKEVLDHFRTIAQGFRIGIAELESAKSKLKKAA